MTTDRRWGTSRPALCVAALAAVLALTGCRTDHYVVVHDDAPLYASAEGEEVVARLPRYHHEPIPSGAADHPTRVAIRYRGQEGFVPRRAVRTFDYLSPAVDGGEAQQRAVGRALREAQLEEVGRGWPASVREAVREGEVKRGMSRRQVELALGWPTTIEEGPLPGNERWIYRTRTRRLVHRHQQALWCGGVSWGCYTDPIAWNAVDRTAGAGWITVWVPIVRERVVEIGPDGRVRDVDLRELPSGT